MLARIVLAVVVAIAVTLACIFIGAVISTIDVAIAVTVGDFLKKFGAAIGILAGIWYFFSGATWPGRGV
jgi:hypothetical protein